MIECLILANGDSLERGGKNRPHQDVEDVINNAEVIGSTLSNIGIVRVCTRIVRDTREVRHALSEIKPDVVFNLVESLHWMEQFESEVAFILEKHQVRFTGSGSLTLRSCLNKAWTSFFLSKHGIRVPKTKVIKSMTSIGDFPLPAIVKPQKADASIGICLDSVVHSMDDIKERARFLLEEMQLDVMVQEYIEGREISVCVLGNRPPFILPPSEIIFEDWPPDKPKVVTYAAKWYEDAVEFKKTKGVRAKLSPKEENTAKKLAKKIYEIMGIRGYGRIDFRLDKHGEFFVVDVNPNCDLNPSAAFARCCRYAGIGYDEMILRIFLSALEKGA